jgi:hypothetical protein
MKIWHILVVVLAFVGGYAVYKYFGASIEQAIPALSGGSAQ